MTVRMAVVIDYQNVHLTAAQLFLPGRPIEESLIDPFRFAKQLAKHVTRMANMRLKFHESKSSAASQSPTTTLTVTAATLSNNHNGSTDITMPSR